MDNKQLTNFVTSHSMKTHPLTRANKKTKIQYYGALEYFVHQYGNDTEYENARLLQYHTMLVGAEITNTDVNSDRGIRSIINDWLRPWRWKYRFWLMCDIALITADAVESAQRVMAKYLSKRQCTQLNTLVNALFTDEPIPQKLLFTESLICQFRMNQEFVTQPEMRVLITANMSAGKSTLINAMIGKPVTRAAQEACTSNLSYLFNKPFEDNSVHLLASPLNLNASYSELMSIERTNISYIASYFRALAQPKGRVCFIDTPGVNSAMNHDHGELTREVLAGGDYDKLLYVLNANKLGTDEELRYLKYVSENVPKDKVIFVLNKIDNFKIAEDSITASIEGVRNDLLQLGYKNPIICPISAYFALLLKMKQNDESLNEDEQDVYDLYLKKFSKAEYDLSSYFDEAVVPIQPSEDELSVFSRRCGISNLENMLYGGIEQ